MASNTYVALKTSTVSVATPTVTISSIPSGYTDLVLVMSGSTSGSINNTIRVGNGSVDTGSNYSCTILSGNGSSAVSTRRSNDTSFQPNYNGYTNTSQSQMIVQFLNYSNTSVYKTMLSRSDNAGTGTDAVVGLWRSTSAIDTIQLLANGGYNWQVGTTFTVYGVAAASVGAKATGGTIYQDASYFYHVFTGNGTFTPSQTLSCDYVVIAGGGAGGNAYGGGGGAGGYRVSLGNSLSATGYSVVVGAGGAKTPSTTAANGSPGTNSSINSFAATGGGFGGRTTSGGSGGSGGSTRATVGSGGSGNAGGYSPVEGYAGATPASGANNAFGGGGGGATAAGGAGVNSTFTGGEGGAGVALPSGWATATGIGSNGYVAGGGGGSGATPGLAGAGGIGGGGNGSNTSSVAGSDGLAYTGSGGGASTDGNVSGNGGSGVVIVRYAK